MMPKQVELYHIKNCARCGKDHEQLIFHLFTEPVRVGDGDIQYTRWAKCPTNGEPILMRYESDIPPAFYQQRWSCPVCGASGSVTFEQSEHILHIFQLIIEAHQAWGFECDASFRQLQIEVPEDYTPL